MEPVRAPHHSLRVYYEPEIGRSPCLNIEHAHLSAMGYTQPVRVQKLSKNAAGSQPGHPLSLIKVLATLNLHTRTKSFSLQTNSEESK